MYPTDYDEFKKTISDLCTAVNRPFNDDLARVFWEDLKSSHLSSVRERAKYLRACGKTRFTSNDLRPEPEPQKPVSTYTPPPNFDNFHAFGQRCLLTFLQRAKADLSPVQLRELVEKKNQLVNDFREMHREEAITAEQVRETLLKAFERVAA